MKLKTKLDLGFIHKYRLGDVGMVAVSLAIIPTLMLAYFGYSGINAVSKKATEYHKQTELLHDLEELRYMVQLRRNAIYALAIQKDSSQIKVANDVAKQGTVVLEKLANANLDPKKLEDVKQKRMAFKQATEPILTNYNDEKFVLKQLTVITPVQNALMGSIDVLDEEIEKGIKESEAAVEAARSGSTRVTLIAILLALFINGGIILGVKVYIIGPLRRSFDSVAKTSDKLTGSSQELSTNADAMSQTTAQITGAISQVASGAAEQSRSAADAVSIVESIANAISQVAESAQGQVRSVSEMADGINKLVDSINDVSESANKVAEVVDSASTVASRGKEAVEETVSGMQKIKETVLDSATKIQTLGEKSKQIGEIIEVIDDIAEQTNLLALNAAIEAARAGEHGKGFAVVADEVRKLAERSAKATGEIAELIKGIQDETMDAVSAMEKGTAEVESGSELAINAGGAIEEIMGSVKQIVTQIALVSNSAQAMAESSSKVSTAVEQIAAISEETSATAEEVASSTSQVVSAVDSIAASSEQAAASAEEVSASAQEQSASVEEIAAQVQALASMSDELDKLVENFNL